MNVIRSITLAIPSSLMPTAVLVIDYCDREHDLEITSIELYGDREAAVRRSVFYETLLGDFGIDDLPRDTQELIYAELAAQIAKQRRDRGMRALWTDLQAMQQESRP